VSKENGFLQLRRGLWEHIRDGRMSITEGLAFICICCQADTRTGVWKGCAKSLSGELGIPERTAWDVLEKLEHGDYIRRFAVPGRHSCYPILVHKFEITQGEHDGEQLNALESRSPVDLAYFAREHGVERNGEHSVEHGAAQRRSENREKKIEKKPAAKTTPPADPRHTAVFSFCFEAFLAKYGQKPTWGAKEGKKLRDFLKEHPNLAAEEISRRYRNLLDSTARFHAEKHGSLFHLLNNFDDFLDGPILANAIRETERNPPRRAPLQELEAEPWGARQ
jgi:hypothetical protein